MLYFGYSEYAEAAIEIFGDFRNLKAEVISEVILEYWSPCRRFDGFSYCLEFGHFDVSDLTFQPWSEVSTKTSSAGPASEASLIAEHVCRASADAESRGPRAAGRV